MHEMIASRSRWLAVWALWGLAGCVDVPDPVDPGPMADGGAPGPDGAPDTALVDRGGADGAPDAGPPRDMALDRGLDAAPDMAPRVDMAPAADVGPPPLSDCLTVLNGPREGEVPCLRVRLVPGATVRASHVSSATLDPGTETERVVIIGGLDGTAEPPAGQRTVRSYDPTTGAWVDDVPDLPTGRWGAGVGRLQDGSLVVVGGSPNREDGRIWQGAAAVHQWSPGAESWRAVDSLQFGRSEGATVTVPSVGVIYVGGRPNQAGDAQVGVDVVDEFGLLTDGRPLAVARAEAAAVTLPERSVLVVGGFDTDGDPIAAVERLGGPTGVITDLPPMPAPVGRSGAAALPDGALFVGGLDARDGEPTAAAMRFESRYNRFVRPDPMFVPRDKPTVSVIGPRDDGWRLVVGGAPTNALAGVVELYDPHRDAFLAFELPPAWTRHRSHHTAASFTTPDGLAVLIAGGYDPQDDPADRGAYLPAVLAIELTLPDGTPRPLTRDCLALAEPAENAPCLQVRRGPPLPGPRAEMGATALAEGPIVVTGGFDPQAEPPLLGETLEMTPGDPAWTVKPPMNVPRAGHRMLALEQGADAALIALGGLGFVDGPTFMALSSVEHRARGGAAWAQSQPLGVGRTHAPLLVIDDRVLLVGGQSSDAGPPLRSTEQFDFEGVERRGDLNVGRTRHVTCLLEGGTALTYGGFTDGGAVGSFETYDVETDAWTDAASVGPALGDSTCISGGGEVDIFGGRATPDGDGSALWQRFSGATGVQREVDRMARARIRPTVSVIGRRGVAEPYHLVVGGEDTADEAGGTVVELIQRTPDRRFVYRLPPELGPRRGHRAVSYTWEARRIQDEDVGRETRVHWRDVVVVGGQDPVGGTPLDEVLVFGLDPYGMLREEMAAEGLPGPDAPGPQ